MYKAKVIDPSKGASWMVRVKKGDIIEMNDSQFKYHVRKGAVEAIEHYYVVTVKKVKCKHCGCVKTIRQKQIQEW